MGYIKRQFLFRLCMRCFGKQNKSWISVTCEWLIVFYCLNFVRFEYMIIFVWQFLYWRIDFYILSSDNGEFVVPVSLGSTNAPNKTDYENDSRMPSSQYGLKTDDKRYPCLEQNQSETSFFFFSTCHCEAVYLNTGLRHETVIDCVDRPQRV